MAGVSVLLPAESREDDPAVALPWSEFSLGICTFSCGRFVVCGPLFVRDGGLISGVDDMDGARGGSDIALIGGTAGGFRFGEFSWEVSAFWSPRGDSYNGAPPK